MGCSCRSPPHTMDAPPLPDFTQLTRASTLELAEAVLAQYQANACWMKAIISVMKDRLEPPAQSPMKPGGSLVAFSRTAVPACSPSLCVCCGYSPELIFFRREGSSTTKRLQQPNFDTELDTDTCQPTHQHQPLPRHCMLRHADSTVCETHSGLLVNSAHCAGLLFLWGLVG